MIASALFIDGKLDRWLANHWAKQPFFQLLSVKSGEVVASVKRSNFRPVWARNGIFRAPISSRIAPKSEFLDRADNFPDHLL
jgi:hypothetical protein